MAEEKKQQDSDHEDLEEQEGEESPALDAQYTTENGQLNVQLKSNNMTSNKQTVSNRKFLYISVCIGNLAAFTCGTMLGWTSPELPKLKSSDENPLPAPLTKSEESWIGSLMPVGAALGPFLAGYVADRFGRKRALLLAAVPFVVAYAILAVATSLPWFLFARLLSGVGAGACFTVLPMYVGEIADDAVRGSLGSFMQLFITVGLLFSFLIGPFVSVQAFNVASLVVPCTFLVVFALLVPESPYFLVKSDKGAAERALIKLRSNKAVHAELEQIKAAVEEASRNKASFSDIFKSRGLTKALILSVGLVSFQQFSGINVVLFFAQDIFTSAGSTIPPHISTIIIGIVQVIASATTPAIIEKRGKRFLLILSAIGMALALATLALFFHLKDNHHDVSAIGWLPVVSLMLFIITYCLGFGPIPWAVMGELFPNNIKSVASTVTASMCWVEGFFLTKYFSLVTDLIGTAGSFGIFTGCCILAAIFTHRYLPETSGKSLQQIQEILSK